MKRKSCYGLVGSIGMWVVLFFGDMGYAETLGLQPPIGQ